MTLNHQSQLDPRNSAITRSSGCTWTTGANGIYATTGGTHHPTPDQVHALVKRSEETNPATPGWSLVDLARACGRYGMAFVDHGGDGWAALLSQLNSRHYVALQGDSDQFGNATCSGVFNGDHCVGIHPQSKIEGGVRWWWIDDPICPTARWEREYVLRKYAEKLRPSIQFGAFLQQVPQATGWEANVPAGTALRIFTVEGTTITKVHIRSKPWTAIKGRRCSAPRLYRWPGHTSRKLVRLVDGAYILAQYAKQED